MKISMMRMPTMSTHPPKYPIRAPIVIPMSTAMPVDTNPIESATRVARMRRAATSEPFSSVPSQCRGRRAVSSMSSRCPPSSASSACTCPPVACSTAACTSAMVVAPYSDTANRSRLPATTVKSVMGASWIRTPSPKRNDDSGVSGVTGPPASTERSAARRSGVIPRSDAALDPPEGTTRAKGPPGCSLRR